MLRRILVEQLDDVLTFLEKADPDLQALFQRLHHVSYAQAVQDDMTQAQAGMAAIFEELGFDVEVPELIKRVLVGTDTSASADLAVSHAAELARSYGAELTVVYVRAFEDGREAEPGT